MITRERQARWLASHERHTRVWQFWFLPAKAQLLQAIRESKLK